PPCRGRMPAGSRTAGSRSEATRGGGREPGPDSLRTCGRGRFELRVGPQRPPDPRHHTLHATLDWSYQLLSPELQRFFARLSVFRGGWTLAAAEAVCEEPFALDHLDELRECSLVQAEAGEERLDPAEVYRGVSDGGRTPGAG